MNFKEIIKNDVRQVFMNTDEFSETHTINGKEMPVQIDSNEQIERENYAQYGRQDVQSRRRHP